MSDLPPIDCFRDWPPIEIRSDEGWETLAREIVGSSGVPDGDVDALATALKSSAAREQAYRDDIVQGWAAIETEAHQMNDAFEEANP